MQCYSLHLLLLVLIFIIFFIVILLYYIYTKKRRKGILNYALSHGFEYDDGSILCNHLLGYIPEIKKATFSFISTQSPNIQALENISHPLFLKGHLKKAENIIYRDFNNKKLFFLDYSYVVGGGKNSKRYSMTISLLKLNNSYPDFVLRPENIIDKIGSFIGFDDIDISGFDEFSKKYYLKGKNKDMVLSFFTPERIMVFEKKLGFYVELSNNILVIHKNRIIPIKDYAYFVDEIINLISEIKID